jgi:hypothetical protein
MILRLRGCAATARQGRLRNSAWQALATAGRTARLVCVTAAAVLVGGSTDLLACPMCFGAEETSLIDGTRLGILVMLGVTLAVQGGFVGFFVYLRRRAKRIAEADLDSEWSELQGASRTS